MAECRLTVTNKNYEETPYSDNNCSCPSNSKKTMTYENGQEIKGGKYVHYNQFTCDCDTANGYTKKFVLFGRDYCKKTS
jgi:hypothetical protein